MLVLQACAEYYTGAIVDAMNQKPTLVISEQEFSALEQQVAALISACNHLKVENRTLRANIEQLQSERNQMLQNNDKARNRVEAIISRLKSMEPGL